MNYPVYSVNIFLALILLIILVGLILLLINAKKRREKPTLYPSPMDNSNIINRFTRNRAQWYAIANDATFRELTNNLSDINSESINDNVGNKKILVAYSQLKKYINSLKLDKDLRITLIYTDGIVFFDSALPISRVYFLQNGLPRPVGMATLASPLKNHNVVPEMVNAVTVHTTDTPLFLLGFQLNDPIYKKMISEGFGFFERISSSLNIPYSYIAKFLPIPSGNGNNTFFLDGVILRIGIPLEDKFFQKLI